MKKRNVILKPNESKTIIADKNEIVTVKLPIGHRFINEKDIDERGYIKRKSK